MSETGSGPKSYPVVYDGTLQYSFESGYIDVLSTGVIRPMTTAQRDAQFTVPSRAHATITVVDYTTLSLAQLTVSGDPSVESNQWNAQTSNDVTAQNIANWLITDAHPDVSVLANVVTVGALSAGSAGNNETITSNNPDLVGSAFTGGGIGGNIVEGTTIYNLDLHQLQVYNGSDWVSFG